MNKLAQGTGGSGGVGSSSSSNIGNPALGTQLQGILQSSGGEGYLAKMLPILITLLLTVGGIIFVVQLILGGIAWISAGGDSKKAEGARTRLTNAFVGLIIMLSVFAVVTLLQSILGVNLLVVDIGSLVIS